MDAQLSIFEMHLFLFFHTNLGITLIINKKILHRSLKNAISIIYVIRKGFWEPEKSFGLALDLISFFMAILKL